MIRGEKTNPEKAVLKIDPDLQFLLDKARENKAVVIGGIPWLTHMKNRDGRQNGCFRMD